MIRLEGVTKRFRSAAGERTALDGVDLEIAAGDVFELQRELQVALGAAWDEELEPFRHASDQTPVVWLHKVG